MDSNPYSASSLAGQQENENQPSRIRRVKRFNPLQTGKLLAVLYFGISLLFVPFILLGSAFVPKGSGMGVGFAIFLPIIYGLLGFIGGAIGAFCYNLCAKFVGGIEVEIE